MKASRAPTIDMTQGSIAGALVAFSLPLIAENLFELLYSTADSVIVGRCVGNLALSAVGSTTLILVFFINIFAALSTGGTVVAARHFGAGDHGALQRDAGTIAILSVVVGIFLAVGAQALVTPVLRWTKTPDDIFALATLYLRVYLLGVPANAVFVLCGGILRAMGNSRQPVYLMCASSVINIFLDLVFVPGLRLGVAGAAAATVISQYAAAAGLLWLFARPGAPCRLTPRQLAFDFGALRQMIGVGVPQVVERSVTSISNIYIQSYINVFGSTVIAGYTIYNRLDTVIFTVIFSLGSALLTFTGQNVGAGRCERLRHGLHVTIGLDLLATAILGGTIVALRYPLAAMFVTDEAAIACGAQFVLYVVPMFVFVCLYQSVGSFLKGVGDVIPATTAMLLGFVVFKQLYLYFGAHSFAATPLRVMFSFPLGWIICMVFTVLYYKSGRWERLLPAPGSDPKGKAA